MYDIFGKYIHNLYSIIPFYISISLFSLLILSIVGLLSPKLSKVRTVFLKLFLLEYVFFIYYCTVFLRECTNTRNICLKPLWGYAVLLRNEEHTATLFPQMMMNVVAFMPVGFLLGVASIACNWKWVVFVGCCISVSIETLQFLLYRGLCEVDDIIHNTLGCLIGYCFYVFIMHLMNKS